MTVTITDGIVTTTPNLILGYGFQSESINSVHVIPGRPDPSITLFGTTLRVGRMELLYPSTTTAEAARELLAQPSTFTFADTEQTDLGMEFVVDGQVRCDMDDESRLYWVVSFDFREVTG